MIVVPLIKFGLGIHRARRNWNDAMNRFRQAAGYGNPAESGASGTPGRNRRKKKKIGRDTGEYVAFEEIAVEERTRTEKPGSTVVTEEQVTDVSWEDIK